MNFLIFAALVLLVIAGPGTYTAMLLRDQPHWLDEKRNLQIRFQTALFCCFIPAILFWLHPYVFSADWKSRGQHWFYYVNDGAAGLALAPLFWAGALSACWSLLHPANASKSLLNLLLLTSNMLICAWYVFFSDAGFLFLLPLIVGIFYALVLNLCLRHRNLAGGAARRLVTVAGWACAVAGSIAYKIQAAKAHYETLPDEGCFVVTAASRGHRSLVGSWIDPENGHIENAQLQTLRAFEVTFRNRLPILHAAFRSVYNIVGPQVARRVLFRWQADLLFLALKPIELTARAIGYFVKT